MSTTTIIIIIAVAVILVAIAFISSHSKHRIVYHEKEISAAIDKVFAESNTTVMDRNAFMHYLRQKLNCSHKELYYLFGKARTSGLVIVDHDKISKPEENKEENK